MEEAFTQWDRKVDGKYEEFEEHVRQARDDIDRMKGELIDMIGPSAGTTGTQRERTGAAVEGIRERMAPAVEGVRECVSPAVEAVRERVGPVVEQVRARVGRSTERATATDDSNTVDDEEVQLLMERLDRSFDRESMDELREIARREPNRLKPFIPRLVRRLADYDEWVQHWACEIIHGVGLIDPNMVVVTLPNLINIAKATDADAILRDRALRAIQCIAPNADNLPWDTVGKIDELLQAGDSRSVGLVTILGAL